MDARGWGLASWAYLVNRIRCMPATDPHIDSNAFEVALPVAAAAAVPAADQVVVVEIGQDRTASRMWAASALTVNTLPAYALVRALLFPCCLITTRHPE